MRKFKKGNKIKLKQGVFCINLKPNSEYTVTDSYSNAVKINGYEYAYADNMFELIDSALSKLTNEEKESLGINLGVCSDGNQ